MDKGPDSRGVYRAIYTNIWDDPDFRSLSPEAKLVFLNIRTSPLSNMPCIFSFYIEPIEKQAGLSRKVIQKALDALCRSRWIAIQDGLVWVRNGLKYDPNISLKNPKHVEAIKKILLGLPKSNLVMDFCDYYGIHIPYHIPNRNSITYPMPIPEPEPEPDPKTETEPEPEPIRVPSEPCQPLVDLFNNSCPNLPKVTELSQSRKEEIKTRLKEHPDLSWWEEVFKKANGISFTGKDGKYWKPSFDWLFENDRNAVKVIEGNYEQRSKRHSGLDMLDERIREAFKKGKEIEYKP